MKTDIEKMTKFYKEQLTQTLKDLLEQVDDIVDRAMEKPTTHTSISINIEPIKIVTYCIEYECVVRQFELNGKEEK